MIIFISVECVVGLTPTLAGWKRQKDDERLKFQQINKSVWFSVTPNMTLRPEHVLDQPH